jgi:hypothetical protein
MRGMVLEGTSTNVLGRARTGRRRRLKSRLIGFDWSMMPGRSCSDDEDSGESPGVAGEERSLRSGVDALRPTTKRLKATTRCPHCGKPVARAPVGSSLRCEGTPNWVYFESNWSSHACLGMRPWEIVHPSKEAQPKVLPHLHDVPAGWSYTRWLERLSYLASICIDPNRAAELRCQVATLAKGVDSGECVQINDLN